MTTNDYREQLDNKVRILLEKISDKDVIIWGISRAGLYAEDLIKKHGYKGNITFIDTNPTFPLYITNVKRDTYLNYVSSDNTVVLSSVRAFSEIIESTKGYGYKSGENLFDIRDLCGGSFIEYINKQSTFCNNGGDFSSVRKAENTHLFKKDNNESTPVDIVSFEENLKYVHTKYKVDNYFDYGCGKGQTMVIAELCGMKEISGIEYEKPIYEQALINMKLLEVPAIVELGDASNFYSIDEYDCFWLYNPFGGDVFKKTIKNLEDSYKRKKRRIVIMYGNPFLHNEVVKNGVFKLKEQLPINLYDPLLNIYLTDI